MSYEIELEKCTIALGGLLLEDGTYLRKDIVRTYYRNFCLGDFQAEKIIKNLNLFLTEAQKMIEEMKKVRTEDLRLAASLGVIINYYPTLKDELKNLARKYF
ncbi:MAG: hypothetical protein QXO95_01415, partial [Candidatus Aenigmatarchaeota archaeon]